MFNSYCSSVKMFLNIIVKLFLSSLCLCLLLKKFLNNYLFKTFIFKIVIGSQEAAKHTQKVLPFTWLLLAWP